MEWILSAAKWIVGKLQGKTSAELKDMQEYYQSRIKFLKEDYEAQSASIQQKKMQHPENGTDLREWEKREEYLHRIIIELTEEKRNIEEELIFTREELKRLKKKHRSMYE